MTDRLSEIRARAGSSEPGSSIRSLGPVVLTCMDPQAREVMETAIEQYRAFRVRHLETIADAWRNSPEWGGLWESAGADQAYLFAYWLFRHSGLVDAHAREDVPYLLAEVERRDSIIQIAEEIRSRHNQYVAGRQAGMTARLGGHPAPETLEGPPGWADGWRRGWEEMDFAQRAEKAEAEVERLRALVDALVTGPGEQLARGAAFREAAVTVRAACRCSVDFTERGLRDPDCQACDLADVLEDRAEAGGPACV